MKMCRRCHTSKDESDFYTGRAVCKECVKPEAAAERQRRYNSLSSSERTALNRKQSLSKVYKLTEADYEILAKDGCAICGSKDNLCVDHDHNCCPGKYTCGNCVRGVLCHKHNKGEGAFESIEEILRLLDYRLRFEAKV